MLIVSGAGKKIKDEWVVENVSFSQQPLEKIAIAGETGSGKTTLLKMIGGHEQIGEGEIKFSGRDILGPLDKLIPGHPGTAYLGQHFELRNNYYVHEVLDYGNKLSLKQSAKIYETCRIDHLLQRKTNELSGGERQRIAFAKVLVTLPKLLLLDEPFSNLDASHRSVMKQVINDIVNDLKTSCIMIAHDAADILSWADKVLVMKNGNLIQQANPFDIYYRPADEYCAGLFGHYNLLGTITSEILFGNDLKHIPGKKVFTRPEELMLSNDGAESCKATVEEVQFFGNYYLVHARLREQVLKVSTSPSLFQKGDTVFITAGKAEARFI
jgi:ABC-type sugar transport system ATPase subunit